MLVNWETTKLGLFKKIPEQTSKRTIEQASRVITILVKFNKIIFHGFLGSDFNLIVSDLTKVKAPLLTEQFLQRYQKHVQS